MRCSVQYAYFLPFPKETSSESIRILGNILFEHSFSYNIANTQIILRENKG